MNTIIVIFTSLFLVTLGVPIGWAYRGHYEEEKKIEQEIRRIERLHRLKRNERLRQREFLDQKVKEEIERQKQKEV